MPASEIAQRIQFEEDIHPVKLHDGNSYKKELSLVEKPLDVEDEERMRRIADDDANHKRKQVRAFPGVAPSILTSQRLIRVGLLCGWRIKVRSRASLPLIITQTNPVI
jgi:hypothetical protein